MNDPLSESAAAVNAPNAAWNATKSPTGRSGGPALPATTANSTSEPRMGKTALNVPSPLAACRAWYCERRCAPKSSAHRENAAASAPATRSLVRPVMIWSTRPCRRDWTSAARRWCRSWTQDETSVVARATAVSPTAKRVRWRLYHAISPT